MPADVLEARTADLDGRRERWSSALEGTSRTYVAVIDCEVVGFASAGAPRDEDLAHVVELHAFYIRARLYGSGLADRLSEPAIGEQAAYLWVLATNPRALAYYRKIGFTADGHTKTDEGFGDAIVMRMVRVARHK